MIREYALLALLALLWGSSYLFIRVAVEDIPPLTLIAIRVSIAALILSVVARARGHRLPRGNHVRGQLFVQAIFNSIGAWTLLAWGQQYVDSGLAGVLNSTTPLFVFFFTFALGYSDTGIRRLAGALTGFAGVILIVGVEVLGGIGASVLGQLAALGGAILYACGALYGRRLHHLPATVTAAGTMIWATVVLVPVALLVDHPWTLSPSGAAIAAALALAVLSTGVALLIYFRLLKTLGPLGVTSQAYLRAAVGVALGAAILGETITLTTMVGVLAALVGVALINAPGRAPSQRKASPDHVTASPDRTSRRSG